MLEVRGIESSYGDSQVLFGMDFSVGTGEVATPDDAQEVCAAIRGRVAETWSPEVADAIRILYGGSVKAANVASIMAKSDVDGALVGGASLQAEEFAGIARFHDMPDLSGA